MAGCLPRSVDFAIGVLAILKAGGVYVPVARDYPVDRQRFMLEDSGSQVVLTARPLPTALTRPNLTVIDVTSAPPRCDAGALDTPEFGGDALDLAYIMYTSGSTGRPKGVAIPHRGVVRLVRGQSYVAFDADQCFLFLSSPSFDASTFELWGPLLNGATCVLVSQDLPDFETLERIVRDQHVTCMWLAAGLFNQLVDQRPSVLESVHHVLTGGEALSVPHVQRASSCGQIFDSPTATGRPNAQHSRVRTKSSMGWSLPRGRCRSATPLRIRSATFWMPTVILCRWACRVSCTSAAMAWRKAT